MSKCIYKIYVYQLIVFKAAVIILRKGYTQLTIYSSLIHCILSRKSNFKPFQRINYSIIENEILESNVK